MIYTHGQGQIIPGLEKELAGMAVGEEFDVKILDIKAAAAK